MSDFGSCHGHSYYSPAASSPMNYSVQDTSNGASDGSMGWLEALAVALGKAAGELADKLNELANQISQQNGASGGSGTGTAVGGDTSSGVGGAGGAGGAGDATQSITDNARLQGLAQEFQQLMAAIENVIKSLGEATTSMARK